MGDAVVEVICEPSFERTAHDLQHLLQNRSSADRLVQQNIIKGGVGIASTIQATQQVLKFQKAVDTMDRKLENRPPKGDLLGHNIIKSKSADSIQATQLALQFQNTKHKLDFKLDNRPDKEHLVDQNIMKAGIAPTLHSTAVKLKFNTTADSLDHKLENRPTQDVLRDHNIIKGNVANSLSATQQQLRFHTLADSIDHKLDHRPTPDNLMDHNIIKSTAVHPVIQERQQILKFKKTINQVGHKMGSRPSKGRLVDNNILTGDLPIVHERKRRIMRQQISASLEGRLEHRPTREQIDTRFRESDTGSVSSDSHIVDLSGQDISDMMEGEEGYPFDDEFFVDGEEGSDDVADVDEESFEEISVQSDIPPNSI